MSEQGRRTSSPCASSAPFVRWPVCSRMSRNRSISCGTLQRTACCNGTARCNGMETRWMQQAGYSTQQATAELAHGDQRCGGFGIRRCLRIAHDHFDEKQLDVHACPRGRSRVPQRITLSHSTASQ